MAKIDTLILGNIISVSGSQMKYEAICVKNGKIAYIGSTATAWQLCDQNTKIYNFGNKYIYSGIIDAHCHGVYAGNRLAFFQELSKGKNLNDYVEIMQQRVASHPNDEFYIGAGWETAYAEKFGNPTSSMLDKISKSKPIVLISSDGHSMWMNTKAMEVFKIDQSSVEKYSKDCIRVDSNNKPTGFISEGPVNGITRKLAAWSKDAIKQAILKWQDFALSYGITSYYEAGTSEMGAQAYTELDKEGKLKLFVFAGWLMDENDPDYIKSVHIAKEMSQKYNTPHFKINSVKLFMDGVVEAHTAWLLSDYSDQKGYTGVKRFKDPERVTQLITEANKLGLYTHCHTIGDGAVHFAVDCIQKAQIANCDMESRNALAHIQMASKEDVDRICDLNITPVIAPLWMHNDPLLFNQTLKYVGPKRMFYSYPLKSFLQKGGLYAFHTDYPVSPKISAPLSIYMACERNYPDKELFLQLNPHECVDRIQALIGLTYGPAYSVKAENYLGSMKIGNHANFVVSDKDWIHCSINELPKAKILGTIIDGELVYKNGI